MIFTGKGIVHLKDIPDGLLSPNQSMQVEATLKQKEFINPDNVRDFLKSLWYPMCFLDFETLSSRYHYGTGSDLGSKSLINILYTSLKQRERN